MLPGLCMAVCGNTSSEERTLGAGVDSAIRASIPLYTHTEGVRPKFTIRQPAVMFGT